MATIPGARDWGNVALGRSTPAQVRGVCGGGGGGVGSPPGDLLLYRYHRPAFARLLALFCGTQALFWTYLAHLAFTSLRDTEPRGGRAEGAPKTADTSLNMGSNSWRYGFTLSCLTVGSSILAAGLAFSRRSVCAVWLHQGGRDVSISTHGLLGGTRTFRAPLRHLSCVAHRAHTTSFLPLRVRGHRLYYLLDARGQFLRTDVFDVTVGAYRKL
ncbi:transmembrane protein 223 [Amblyraja radiata]|uniref:transmembrane protein 223 n=1 Tax=Amblyraja radiata TaxID=386614 RepID=UPI001402FC7D|nr:transmembrane protein 223 [Amblyraja radiata]